MITIREFKPEDVDDIIQIQEENKKDLGDLYTKESLIEESKHIKLWVAEEDGKVLGYVGFMDLKNGIGMMLSLVIDVKHQGKGIGSKLTRKVKEYAKENKYRKVLFLTKVNNKSMLILGMKEDFQPEGILRRHFRTGEDVLYMSYFIEENY